MSSTIYFDSTNSDETRRTRLYDGSVFIFSPTSHSLALCDFAHGMIQEAFGGLDARLAQHSMAVEEYAGILAQLKPKFIHHPRSKECIQGIMKELGCELDKTYFDVPRMRTSTSGGYLTTGIAYAWHPHRDTWYSAPPCQLNWWIPIYDLEPNDGMAFHPRYWDQPVRNDSSIYNYYRWNKEHRPKAAEYVTQDTRPLPRPIEPVEVDSQVRPICRAGSVMLFSAAQLHSTVPNTSERTRFSIDFRSVNVDDVVAQKGAPNIDSSCTGTSLRDFLRGSDLCRMPEEIASLYDPEPVTDGELIYQPPSQNKSSDK